MEQHPLRYGNAPLGIFHGWTARLRSPVRSHASSVSRSASIDVGDIQTSLGYGGIDLVSGQQTMALRSDIADLEHGAVGQFALDGEVVLRGVLRAEVGSEFTVEKDGAKQRQIGGSTFGGGDDAAERIGSCVLALID